MKAASLRAPVLQNKNEARRYFIFGDLQALQGITPFTFETCANITRWYKIKGHAVDVFMHNTLFSGPFIVHYASAHQGVHRLQTVRCPPSQPRIR